MSIIASWIVELSPTQPNCNEERFLLCKAESKTAELVADVDGDSNIVAEAGFVSLPESFAIDDDLLKIKHVSRCKDMFHKYSYEGSLIILACLTLILGYGLGISVYETGFRLTGRLMGSIALNTSAEVRWACIILVLKYFHRSMFDSYAPFSAKLNLSKKNYICFAAWLIALLAERLMVGWSNWFEEGSESDGALELWELLVPTTS